jgi:hypothetical protein
MTRRGLAVLVAAVAVACGAPPPTQQPTAATTTTGILPPGAPTEGSRPPADALPRAAEPQNAPQPTTAPPGRVVPVGAAPEGVVVDAVTRTVAVAKRNPNELILLSADSGLVIGRTGIPGFARHLQLAAPGGPILVPVESVNALIRVELPSGQAEPLIFTGTVPHDAAQAKNGTVFIANELGGTVAAVRGDAVVKVFTDSVQPAGLAPVGTAMGLIDVRKNDLTIYDAEALTIVGSTPAGAGPTHLVADRHGRMIATDTRGNAIRVFTPLPTPREIAAVSQAGGPYGITYDAARDRLWVASSGTNEIVGYDMAQPTPREVRRYPTVRNPYTVGVDSVTGRLFVAGVTTGVVQIIDTE